MLDQETFYSLDSDTYAQMRYELEPLSPVCQMCQIVDLGSEKELREAGWLFATHTSVCPKCLSRLEFYEIGKGSKRVEQEMKKAA